MTVNGDGLVQDVTKHGHYSVRYGFGVPFQGTLTTILDTDYDEYAVVYSCTNSLLSGMFHSEYIWILSKDGVLSNPTRQNIYEKLDKLKINRSGLQLSDRGGCPNNSTTVQRETEGEVSGKPSSTTPSAPLFDVIPQSESAESSVHAGTGAAGPAVIASTIAEVVPGAIVAPLPPAAAALSPPVPVLVSSPLVPAAIAPVTPVKPVAMPVKPVPLKSPVIEEEVLVPVAHVLPAVAVPAPVPPAADVSKVTDKITA